MNLCVLSACYDRHDRAAILAESCLLNRLPLLWCEAKEWWGQWLVQDDLRTGKLRAALETISENRCAYDYWLWADGFDTFIQASALSIEGRWNTLHRPPLVFSAEKNCYPHQELADQFPDIGSPYRFPNTGAWLGHNGYLLDVIPGILKAWEHSRELNDQALWQFALLEGKLPGAVIDSERHLFQSMWQVDESEAIETPVVHYNGEASWGRSTRYQEHWARVKARYDATVNRTR